MRTAQTIKQIGRSLIIVTLLLSQQAFSQTVTLKIIETTDEHGAVFPYDFIRDKPASGSLAQVQTYVQQQRQIAEQNVILLSAGDLLQGQPTVYYYNFEQPQVTHLYARVMNYMGYDAGAVGNHDIEAGHAVYDKFTTELKMPWLAANAVKNETGEPYFQPYAILNKQGVKIAVLGMVTPGIPKWLPQKIWAGITFLDMIESARKWLDIIREQEKPDLVIGLFHSGVDFNYGGSTAETPRNENASRLVAEQVPGFDIIFAGHDHQVWNFTSNDSSGKPVPILGAGAHARNVAVATVTMTLDENSTHWQKAISSEIVDMRDFEPDTTFLTEFSQEFQAIKQYVSRPIGEFSKTISTREALFGDAAFVDFVHQIQLELTGADISVSAPLSLDATIEKGPLFVRDMFKLYKYENLLYTMRLTGKEIKGFLEFSYGNWFNQMHGPEDHLLIFKKKENGEITSGLATPLFNYDSMAGLEYVVDVSKPAGNRVHILALADGRLFDMAAQYKVAINSYRGTGGGGHLTQGAGINEKDLDKRLMASTDKDLRYFLMKWIERKGQVTAKPTGNWQVTPQDWWQAGKERDEALLFKKSATQD